MKVSANNTSPLKHKHIMKKKNSLMVDSRLKSSEVQIGMTNCMLRLYIMQPYSHNYCLSYRWFLRRTVVTFT